MNSVSTFRKFLLRTRFAIVLAVVLASAAEAQVVKGKVTSREDGTTMPGVNILIKGSQTGTSTDASGAYSLEVGPGNPTLVFSFVGYVQEEVLVSGRSVIDVAIAPSAENLKEVVVTALGISREARSLAYSVSSIKGEDMVKAGNPNLLKSLDGKVSGVNFTNLSSDPTSSVLVNIRGTTAMPTTSNGGTNGYPSDRNHFMLSTVSRWARSHLHKRRCRCLVTSFLSSTRTTLLR
ncbi:carboxypeptidase-like regulatory domain-containing protein [Paucibacter sp. O1-1]|nr:carboxypeptidase-like regulatory domain-containing protein [Paucibacter sp. O1-1]MDA3830755.1 carboxypeptidase-like regulatory domain-containing protein [Paucibacter sp. O1-1]